MRGEIKSVLDQLESIIVENAWMGRSKNFHHSIDMVYQVEMGKLREQNQMNKLRENGENTKCV